MSVIPTKIKNKELVEKRRHQIIQGSIKLFSKKGFHKSTLKEIAEVSGVSHGSIYDYINTKEDLFFLIQDVLFNYLDTEINRTFELPKEPLEKLRSLLEAEFNNIRKWKESILLIYQESHILRKSTLKKLLTRERGHISKWESVLDECIQKGLFRTFNVRLVANLIKMMIDTWVLKAWDLKGYTTQSELERTILDILIYGLIEDKDSLARSSSMTTELQGKQVALMNGGTEIGTAISSFLLSKGAKVAIQGKRSKDLMSRFPIKPSEKDSNISFFDADKNTFEEILMAQGSAQIIIHDLSAGNSNHIRIEENLRSAQHVAITSKEKMLRSGVKRIIYLAPWAWDRNSDPIIYEIVRAGTIALTKTLAREMAASKINVNCIVPGFIQTARSKTVEKEIGEEVLDDIPMGYLGEVSDIIEALSFLLSDASRYVTGQVLSVCGGTDLLSEGN